MPRLHATWKRDPETKKLTECVAFGSPGNSELRIHREGAIGVRFELVQKDGSEYWKPNEIELDIEALRAVRDTITRMIDTITDERDENR